MKAKFWLFKKSELDMDLSIFYAKDTYYYLGGAQLLQLILQSKLPFLENTNVWTINDSL